MQDASLAEASVEEKTADQLLIEDLMDKIEGLTADLEDAVEVAVSRGAVEWAALNYPDHPALKSEARRIRQSVRWRPAKLFRQQFPRRECRLKPALGQAAFLSAQLRAGGERGAG